MFEPACFKTPAVCYRLYMPKYTAHPVATAMKKPIQHTTGTHTHRETLVCMDTALNQCEYADVATQSVFISQWSVRHHACILMMDGG